MKILIIGTGYVGLVTGACFAEMGHQVICLDIDESKIALLQEGQVPFFEPSLGELVARNKAAGRLNFTTDFQTAMEETSICFIAVPTPSTATGSCDLSFVLQATTQIAENMQAYQLIVTKSTVPVGTSEEIKTTVAQVLEERGLDLPFDVVSNPEFLKEGSAVADCLKPDRIIFGVESERAETLMRKIYASFTLNHDRVLVMDPASAEMTKYAANAMLATRISFMNELANLCEKLGANIHNVRLGIGSDNRIGYQFLYAGAGFGGSCFPKDLRALISMADLAGHPTPLLHATLSVNEEQKRLLARKIHAYFHEEGGVQGKTIALWGLSFKPDTDDIREAPSLVLIEELRNAGAKLRLYDPVAMPAVQKLYCDEANINFCRDEYDAAQDADAIVLVTEWKQFRSIDFQRVLSMMAGRAFFDGRNQYKAQEMHDKGFTYFGIGIPNRNSSSLQILESDTDTVPDTELSPGFAVPSKRRLDDRV